jgi:dTMP kinase
LLVAVCGIDGSGKTVQVEKLCARAEKEGLTARSMEFPRYGEGFFAELVERYLRGDFGRNPSDVSPYLAALPYAGDRWEAAETLRGWLREGGLVVCNRYVPANIAHQGAKLDGEAELEDYCRWVRRLEYDVYGIPRPDLHLWLDMPPAAAGGLARGRSDEERPAGGEDIHEGDVAYLRQTRNVYRWLAERNDDWGRIECARDGEADSVSLISERIWNTLKNRLLAAE